ncbi:hypothetical protein JCM19237_5714 [Photobacterium aphoticum]|uniref:Uncharacterized protein n=1 Tax=Photobacterium aphoticum TaxID=754436 RepID=A0A090QIQ8_9GAMM|nr:hypothetical protein JCM19237_5714 [Photobacterium aphoticum]
MVRMIVRVVLPIGSYEHSEQEHRYFRDKGMTICRWWT